MSSINCNFESIPRIRAPYPYFNAVIHERLNASGIPIPEGLPETARGQWTQSVEAPVDLEANASSGRTKVSDFFVECNFMKSLQNKCAGLNLPWKSGFSQTNRHLWKETLRYAVQEFLEDEIATTHRSIDEEGVDRYVQLIESAIFHYVARNPAEYGNSMAIKYDSIRGGDFSREERQLIQQLAWL